MERMSVASSPTTDTQRPTRPPHRGNPENLSRGEIGFRIDPGTKRHGTALVSRIAEREVPGEVQQKVVLFHGRDRVVGVLVKQSSVRAAENPLKLCHGGRSNRHLEQIARVVASRLDRVADQGETGGRRGNHLIG